MDITKELSKRSLCLKIQTACLIVKNTQILSIGYNGTFSGKEECCELWKSIYDSKNLDFKRDLTFSEWLLTSEFKNAHRDWSLKEEVHAEINALLYISKRDITKDYILYTLYSPCDACTKEIIAYGISNIYYKYEYSRGSEALKRLSKMGINCQKII